MTQRQQRKMSRRSFLARSGALGLAASTAGLAGGLSGCPADAWKAARAYTLAGGAALLTPVEDEGPYAYELTITAASPKVAWIDESARRASGNERLDCFLAHTWPAAFSAIPPHGMLTGRIPGTEAPAGFRVEVARLSVGDAPGSLSARIFVLDELWEDLEAFVFGQSFALDNAVLHLLPTTLDEEDPEHVLVHHASSVEWAAGNNAGRSLLILHGIAENAAWLNNGFGRLGGRNEVSEQVTEWAERYAGEPADAWLWQVDEEGTPVPRQLSLFTAEYAPEEKRLTFEVENTEEVPGKSGNAATLVTDAGKDTNKPGNADFSAMRFTEEHSWVLRIGDSENFVFGITSYALGLIGDVTYFDFPTTLLGTVFTVGDVVAELQTVKMAGEVYMPFKGIVDSFNEILFDEPFVMNEDPYGNGWIIKGRIKDFGPLANMMTYEQYQEYVKELDE